MFVSYEAFNKLPQCMQVLAEVLEENFWYHNFFKGIISRSKVLLILWKLKKKVMICRDNLYHEMKIISRDNPKLCDKWKTAFSRS